MSDFNKRNEWIDKYCSGELDGDELDRFEKILADDKKLQEEVDIERQLNAALSNPDLVEFRRVLLKVKTRKERSFWKPRWLLAAVIIILVTTGYTAWLLIISGNRSQDQADVPCRTKLQAPVALDGFSDSNEAPVEQRKVGFDRIAGANEVLADCMTPYPYLEGLIGEETRSPGFILISPDYRTEMKAGDSLCFRWIITSVSAITLEIVDNKGNTVADMPAGNPDYVCYSTKGQQQGLFYWKLIRSNELLCVGRFVVK